MSSQRSSTSVKSSSSSTKTSTTRTNTNNNSVPHDGRSGSGGAGRSKASVSTVGGNGGVSSKVDGRGGGDGRSRSVREIFGLALDPTFLFAVSVFVLPAALAPSREVALRYFTMPIVIGAFAVFTVVVLFTHFFSGTTRALKSSDRLRANWFLCNGVFFNCFLDVLAGQFQLMGLMSQQYLIVEPRYEHGLFSTTGQSVFMTSILEILFQSPLCVATYWAYHHDAPWRTITELTASLLHLSGIWFMYLPEALCGFPHLATVDRNFEFGFDHILYYWFGYWTCGLLWTVVPLCIIAKVASEVSNAFKKRK